MSKNSSAGTLPSLGIDRTDVPVTEAVIDLARKLWPYKTARQLASRCGVNHRSAEHWISQRSGMSSEAIVNLLRSDKGFVFLRALMGGAPGSWWSDFDADMRARDIETRLSALRTEIEEARSGLASVRR